MKSIDVHELKAWRDEGKAHQLIDLREDFEVETGHLGEPTSGWATSCRGQERFAVMSPSFSNAVRAAVLPRY